MDPDEKTFWFPAKTYGYGWGLPCRWQGWVVFIGYLVLLAGGLHWIARSQYSGLNYWYMGALSAVLILIVWVKGERPRWRWGKKE